MPLHSPRQTGHWQQALLATWQTRGWLAGAMWPISLLVRACWEILQVFRRRKHPIPATGSVPWVVVGNVVIGGAGKTPTTIALVRHWQQQGHRPGVVSKGYGRTKPSGSDRPLQVFVDTPAHECGDEPLLIHQVTGAPVAVGPHRLGAGQWLLQQHPEIDVLICDDGLQDTDLLPTARLIVFDDRAIGNGWMLPAGLLRQPWPPRHLQSGDVVVFTASPSLPVEWPGCAPIYTASRRLDTYAMNALGDRKSLEELAQSGTAAAWAGIARPDRFFSMLQQSGIVLNSTVSLADHQHFGLDLYSKLISQLERELVFFTEKDAVKLFPALRQAGDVAARAWAVPLAMDLPETLLAELDARLSLRNGSQAA